jgi:hypothetical protein
MRTGSRANTAAIALVAAGTLAVAACGARDLPDARTQPFTASPMAVSCEPNQPGTMQPVVYMQPAYGYSAADTARVVPVSYPAARTIAPRRYASTPVRYERRTRSVKKSALIIGGSAGAGAGIGAAIGGKKGALIGALLGGGGATVWDQITRHQ